MTSQALQKTMLKDISLRAGSLYECLPPAAQPAVPRSIFLHAPGAGVSAVPFADF